MLGLELSDITIGDVDETDRVLFGGIAITCCNRDGLIVRIPGNAGRLRVVQVQVHDRLRSGFGGFPNEQ